MALQIPTVTIDDLHAFHTKHFPHAPAPEGFLHGVAGETAASEELLEEEDDGLGYYPDGVQRTLTDEQIAMFRHSEIQTVIRKRRLRKEDGEPAEEKETSAGPLVHPSGSLDSRSQPSTKGDNGTDKVQSVPLEKAKDQQWATSSARTKARNKKHRDKYRLKKKAERRRREAGDSEDDNDSDEWDPWHQANGPDVLKDDAIDLDY